MFEYACYISKQQTSEEEHHQMPCKESIWIKPAKGI